MKLIKLSALLAVLGIFTGINASAADTNTVAKLKPYTLDKCLVSNEGLDSMGKPYVTNYLGQEIKFCCKGCVKDFDKDRATYIKKIEAAKK